MTYFIWIFSCLVALAAVPAVFLLVQVLFSLHRRPAAAALLRGRRMAVLVPAHDEESGIEATLRAIQPQLGKEDRLLVVADNCSDRTGELAARAGAEVLTRTSEADRGKGFALAAGIRHLGETGAPEVVIVVDADCMVEEGCLARLAEAAAAAQRPAQALNLMHAPPGAGAPTRITVFAVKVKNHVRPLGSSQMGLAAPILGTGFALPWDLSNMLASGSSSIVEDFEAGVRFVERGRGAVFVPEAVVRSWLPASAQARASQQQRWEYGVMAATLAMLPRLLLKGIRRLDFRLLGFCLDMSVPPLTLFLGIALLLTLVSLGIFGVMGAMAPLLLSCVLLGSLLLAVGLCLWQYGRGILSPWDILSIPLLALRKMRHYAAFAAGKRIGWVRTERD